MRTVLNCVNYCHQHKIVHRDLKPENILLERDEKAYDELKIIDFGTSLYYDPQKHEKSEDEGPGALKEENSGGESLKLVIGTPYYIAPEVIKKNYGSKCDIWSCGVILYAMLCGSLPFDDEQLAVLFMKIKQGNYRMPVEIPPDCKDLIRRML